MQFLDVKTDFAFKKVFGSEQSKEILIDFLNSIIDFKDENIVDLTIVDPYEIPLIKGMKDSYVDVKAILSNQTKVIIEMQVLNFEGFEKRVLYNAAKLYSTQLKKGQKYETLEPIIALTITDFVMFKEFKKVISFWDLREKEKFIEYSNDIELVFVELPKFNKTENELKTITDKWIYFIKNAGDLDYIPKTFVESELLEAFDIANTSSLNEEELELQFKRKDFIHIQKSSLEKAKKDGRKEGRKEEKYEIVKQMIDDKLPIEKIIKYTGLSEEEIQKLKEQA